MTFMHSIKSAPFSLRHQPLADGCFRDNGRLWLADDGTHYALEWTPTLNEEELSIEDCHKLIVDCALAGGGFLPPTAAELETLVDRAVRVPATHAELRTDTKSDWYVTSEMLASSSGCAWFVDFSSGGVGWGGTVYGGFARGVRRVAVASPSQ